MNKFVYTSDFNFLWINTLNPIGNSFYFPYKMVFFHQYRSEKEPFTNKHQVVFLKDGILGLMPIISDLIKNASVDYPLFAISKNMAPLIPTFLKKHFLFYDLNSSPSNNTSKNLLIFLGSLSPYTSTDILQNQLKKHRNRFNNLYILRNLFEERIEIEVLNRRTSPLSFLERYEWLHKQTGNSCLEFSLETFLKLPNLHEYYFLNTDHYNFFCSLDFLSYYYYFKTGIFPESYFKPNSQFFHKIKKEDLVKNLSVDFFEYNGPGLIDESTIDFLSIQYFPPMSRLEIKPGEFYTREVVRHAEGLAEKLFQFNLENSLHAPQHPNH